MMLYRIINKKEIRALLFLSIFFTHLSCKKFVQVDVPKDRLVSNSIFSENGTANAAVVGIFSKMFNDLLPYYIPLCTGLSADELKTYANNADLNQLFSNSITPSNSRIQAIWTAAYNYIYQSNLAIEGLQRSNSLNESVKRQLIGESEFVRAFWYFYLTNLFGEIPLILSSDYKNNSTASQSSQAKIYQQIVTDLKDAKQLLSDKYLKADGMTPFNLGEEERVRPTKWAASALLARTYLYNKDWTNAEAEATLVISSSSLYDTVPLNDVFLKNNKEAIWQLQTVVSNYNTPEGLGFNALITPPLPLLQGSSTLSTQLVNAFEAGDNRKLSWINPKTSGGSNYNYPYKYKVRTSSTITEYSTVLRLAEQYLIRSEAEAQLNKISQSQADLNIVRKRANLPPTAANDQQSLLAAILQERRVELFTEWGHRWLDLKRTGNLDAVMTIVTPQKSNNSSWQPYKALFPIPQNDRNNDPNLGQNQGY